MCNVYSCNKKFTFIIIVAIILVVSILFFDINKNNYVINKNYVFATNDKEGEKKEKFEEELNNNIDNILGDIDTEELDEFIENDFSLEFLNSFSFLDLVKKVLSNDLFNEYNSLFLGITNYFKDNFKSLLLFFFTLFSIIILNEMFASFCVDKYGEIKKVVNLIFSLILVVLILYLVKDLYEEILGVVNKIFNFSKTLFPMLLGLILLSGSNGTFTSYTTLSTFLIETGSYLFLYIIIPIVSSIVTLQILNIIFKDNKFSKLISLLKTIFKYIIVSFFAVFGLFSMINIVTSGTADGVNYKLTKFAIKSYIPVLGGYISDGFDFVHTCSVLVKNSFGICGIIVLFFIILQPILHCVIYIILFKVLAVFISFIGKQKYANYFDSVSSGISYLISVLVGIFMCSFVFIYLLIMSVSVV
ncbi:MAG: hypothetical protein IJX17_04185 [Clostridia bacterium]|nr:hypothetical protein [Clostridia bacterium]